MASKTPKDILNQIKKAKENKDKELYLYGSLEQIPDEVYELEYLEELDLSGNEIKSIPPEIRRLKNLKQLDLRRNPLEELIDVYGLVLDFGVYNSFKNQVTKENIVGLKFEEDELKSLKEVLQFENLTTLDLSGCQLTEIPEFIGQLKGLTSLNLGGNKLTEIPESIGQLKGLTFLELGSNQITEIPESIGQLKGLTSLYLYANKITDIPEFIVQLPNLQNLIIAPNPIENPPPEVVNIKDYREADIEKIKNYFLQLEREGKDYLYEAKMLIVGEGGAGKTTLANKIKDEGYELQEEDSTKGIDVIQWEFPLSDCLPTGEHTVEPDKNFRVNIWDFGGQAIYHATHQFFLTKRSLYILVADTRKEDTDFYYWLKVVELLSDNSPLIIVKNEKQDRHREINERLLRGQFTNLKETLATNLADNRGLAVIKKEIKNYISKLPHIGSELPKTWVKVRQTLEGLTDNYISFDKYLEICRQNGFTERKDKLQLSDYLHDLGVCLHFKDDPVLKKTMILKSNWGTDAVYMVLDNPAVIRNLGRFNRDDLAGIWVDEKYADMHDELLRLMINFKLCYQIPGKEDFIAPQLLTENQPKYEWDEENNIILRYTYEFMPKGIVTQLIVALHQYIKDQKCVWKSGVVLTKDNTKAEIVEYYGKREIKIRLVGKHKKELMTIVTYELDKIHDSYKQLKYNKLIPCNCSTCKNSQKPTFYKFDDLKKCFEDKKPIQCLNSYEMIDVTGLIDDVIGREKLIPEEKRGHEKLGDFVFQGPVDKVIVQQSGGEKEIEKKEKQEKIIKSAWANGSFYLFAFVVVSAGLAALSNYVDYKEFLAILIAGPLLVLVIGALQLKHDDRLKDKHFVELMKIVLKQLPLISKFFNQNDE